MSNAWYYRDNGIENGPVSFDDIFELAQNGVLTRNHTVRTGSDTEWVPADSIVGLFPDSPADDGPQEIASLDDLDFQLVSGSAPAAETQQTRTTVSAPPEPEDVWYYRSGSIELGPIGFEELAGLAETGTIGPDDLFREGDDGEWLPGTRVARLKGRFTEFVAPPSPPVREIEQPPPPPAEPEEADDDFDLKDDEPKDEEPKDEEPAGATPALKSTIAADRWFCQIDGIEHGPLTKAELTSMATHQRLARANLVREGDDGEWVAAARVPDLFADVKIEQPTASVADKFAPPKPVKAKKQKKSRGPRQPLGETLKENKNVLLGAAGVVVLLLGLFLMTKLFGGGSGETYYKELDAMWSEHKALRDRKAPPTEWSGLEQRAAQFEARIKVELKKTEDPAERQLLFAGRDYLLPMLQNCKKEAGNEEAEFGRLLRTARLLLDNPSMTIDQALVKVIQEQESQAGRKTAKTNKKKK